MSEFLLVDGNNVIHAWPDLLKLHHQRGGLAHEELCRRLATLYDATGERVVVVFDGRGGKLQEDRETVGLQIIYTDGDRTADDVIERLATKYAATYSLTVATNDVPEQDLVVAVGGFAISVDSLRSRIETAETQIRRFTL